MAEFNMSFPTSENSSEWILEEMNAAEVKKLVPVIVFLALIAVFGLLGNGVVCHVYRTRYRLSNSQCFILCLSAIDLFSCCVVIPFEIATVIQQYNFQLLWLCKISRSLNSLSTLSGSFLLIFISIDRYRKVCHPFRWQISPTAAKVLCVMTPFLGLVFSWPSLVLYGKKTFDIPQYNITGTECSTDDNVKETLFPFINQLIFGVLFVVGVIVMSVLYCLIGREVYKHVNKTPRRLASSNTSIPMLSSSMGPKESKVNTKLNMNGAVLSKGGSPKKSSSRRFSKRRKTRDESDVSWAEKTEHSTSEDEKSGETNRTNETNVISLAIHESLDLDIKEEKKKEFSDTSSEDSGIKSEPTAKEEKKEVISGNSENGDPLVCNDLNMEEIESGMTLKGDPQKTDEVSLKDIDIEKDDDSIKEVEEETPTQNKPGLSRNPFGATVKGRLNLMKHRMSSVISRMRNGGGERSPGTLGKVQFLKQARARRTAFLMFLITLFFILSHLPHLLLMLIRSMTSQLEESMSEDGKAVYKFFLRSYFLDRAINPIIYGVCDSRFRSSCKKMLSCCRAK